MQVYCIENKINGKLYIGKDQKSNPEYYGSGTLIKLTLKKYGIDSFEKKILEEVDDKILLCEKERYWIKKLNTLSPNGYNIQSGGINTDTMTNHPNKDEIFENRTKNNPDMYKKIVDTRRKNGSYTISNEQKKLISKNNKSGTVEVKDKLSKWNLENSPTAKQYTIEIDGIGEFVTLNKMNEVEDFVKQYNIENNIPYRNRVNWWKLLYKGESNGMTLIDKQRLNRRNCNE